MSIDITTPTALSPGDFVLATPLDLAHRFGDIPLWRIGFDPPPGQATEAECIAINERSDRLCELVDGTLVEKVMGSYESLIAGNIVTEFNIYLKQHRIGIALPSDGMLKLRFKLIRVPDASFISKENLRAGSFPRHGVAAVAPTIAVEVISEGNTRREMEEKLDEYFQYGAAEVWYVYPNSKSVVRYTARSQSQTLTENETLTTPVLPGFSCPIAPLFAHPADEFGDLLETDG
ncbi:MAG: Uma2 family endonuclease [Pirellulaceae bacterium]